MFAIGCYIKNRSNNVIWISILVKNISTGENRITIKSIIIYKTCHSKVIKGKLPCQAVINDLYIDEIPQELASLAKLEQILVSKCIVFQKIIVMPKGQQRKIKGTICNIPVECDQTCNHLPSAPESSGIIRLKLKRKLQFRGHVYFKGYVLGFYKKPFVGSKTIIHCD